MRLKPAALWIFGLGSYLALPAQVPGPDQVPAPELTWRRQFGGARDERWPSLVQTPDGGYVLLANSEAYGAGDSQDVALLKVSSEGELEWEARWGGPQNELGASLDRTKDDGFIVGGGIQHHEFLQAEAYLARTDSMGNLLWEKTYGRDGYNHVLGSSVHNKGGTIQDLGNRILLDSTGDVGVDVSDAVYVFHFLFFGGLAPILGERCVAIPECPASCAP